MDPQPEKPNQPPRRFEISDEVYTPLPEDLKRRIISVSTGPIYAEENVAQLIKDYPIITECREAFEVAHNLIRISRTFEIPFETLQRAIDRTVNNSDSYPYLNSDSKLVLLRSPGYPLILGIAESYNVIEFLEQALKDPMLIIRLSREERFRDSLMEVARNGPDIEAARKYLLHSYYDEPPYERYNQSPETIEAVKKIRSEVMSVYRRQIDLSYGFEALKVEAQRIPGKNESLLIQLGKAHADSTYILNSSSHEDYPGNGLVYSGFRTEEIFASSGQKSSLMPEEYLQSVPWMANVFHDFSRCQIAEIRGVLVINPPRKYEYTLDNIPYVMLTYNEHQFNPFKVMSLLVPKELVWPKISEAMIPVESYKEFDPNMPKINGNWINPLSLYKEAKKRGLNILNLGSISNLAGLVNAYPPKSEPYFAWESCIKRGEPGIRGYSTDLAGHVHKINNTLMPHAQRPKLSEQDFFNLRNGNHTVLEIVTRFYRLYDSLRLTRSLWHKGLTTDGNEQHSFAVDNTPLDIRDRQVQMLPAETRMLEVAYQWHELHRMRVKDIDKFKILSIAPALDHASPVTSPILLDTYDMRLKTLEGEIQLPRNSDGSERAEKEIWALHVRPFLGSLASDLRFYDRTWEGLKLG